MKNTSKTFWDLEKEKQNNKNELRKFVRGQTADQQRRVRVVDWYQSSTGTGDADRNV